jgi:Na+-transporting NADH:ubiquinone oxidoreductase subunit A
MIKVRHGLDLPISGAPQQSILEGQKVSQVAVVGHDYPGMKPTMVVRPGDRVSLGQLLFTDKKNEGVKYTAPAAGTIAAIHRGDRRVFQSLVIDVEGDDSETFPSYGTQELSSLDRETVVSNLVDSGQWVALRTRPYSKVPAINSMPASIFVTAMDTNPLAADPAVIIKQRSVDFLSGLKVLTRLTTGAVNLCVAPNSSVVGDEIDGVTKTVFSGPHPAGLPGTHIHFVDPVSASKTVWSIGYQDVIGIGTLFTTGRIDNRRVVALGGPQVNQPRLLQTQLGANLDQLLAGELAHGENRIVSGSLLAGRKANAELAYLGRYHVQVSVIREGRDREHLHYLRAGVNKHSALPIYVSSLSKKLFSMTSSTNGSERAMVPVGAYEDVTALDILPVQLLRSLIVGDTEMAQSLGCLELDEEDVGLYAYVCVGKYEYGAILRDNLNRIEKEG